MGRNKIEYKIDWKEVERLMSYPFRWSNRRIAEKFNIPWTTFQWRVNRKKIKVIIED